MLATQRSRLCNRATLTEPLEDEARDLGGTVAKQHWRSSSGYAGFKLVIVILIHD